MIGRGWPALVGPVLLAGAAALAEPGACPEGQAPGLAVTRLTDGAVLARAQAAGFALHWRHSVTLTPVEARYALLPGGAIVQTEERFAAHGPGMAHDAPGWRREGEMFVLPLARAVDRLVLRAAAEHENRLAIAGQTIDLTRWPGVPIDLVPLPCEETRP